MQPYRLKGGRLQLTRLLLWFSQSYGGAIATDKAQAKVFVVDEDSPDNKSTATIKRQYGSDVKKWVVPYQWVEKSIQRGGYAPLPKTAYVRSDPSRRHARSCTVS